MSTNNFIMNADCFNNYCYFSTDETPEDAQFDYECTADNAKFILNEKNKELSFFKMKIQGGYYDGLQAIIESNIEYLAAEDIANGNFSNEDSRYFWNLCRSIAIRKIKTEINKINRELARLKDYGFKEFIKTGQFSNGEGLYQYK